jgi:phosphoglycerate dehydrogenase-like enzyme
MPGLLFSRAYFQAHGAALMAAAARHGLALTPVVLPADPEARADPAHLADVEVALFSSDIVPTHARQFFSAVFKCPHLAWVHIFNAGVDHQVFTDLQQKGVRISTSSGANAEAVALAGITGMLMLSRGFPQWLAGQQAREWRPMRGDAVPRDLRGQAAVVVGVGAIGRHFARMAQGLGLRVIGVRRSPRTPEDPVDDMQPPALLAALLPAADWLVLACPLTAETRRLVDATALARLPKGARIVNIGRGEVVDEPAMIDALRSGQLGGAYLDVFEKEPLPAESPLWDLPNVLLSPHNSAASGGNDARVNAIFEQNLARYARREPLANEVKP